MGGLHVLIAVAVACGVGGGGSRINRSRLGMIMIPSI